MRANAVVSRRSAAVRMQTFHTKGRSLAAALECDGRQALALVSAANLCQRDCEYACFVFNSHLT